MTENINPANGITSGGQNLQIQKLKKKLAAIDSTDFASLADIHFKLMKVYYKHQRVDPQYLFKTSFHAKKALKFGHNSGVAAYRLVVNLSKQNKIHQAIEVCGIVLDSEYHFSKTGNKKKSEFAYKLKMLKRKLKSHSDSGNRLFSKSEVLMIKKNSQKEIL